MFAMRFRQQAYLLVNALMVIKVVTSTFKDEQYFRRVYVSRQRWLDNDIHEIADGIMSFLEELKQ